MILFEYLLQNVILLLRNRELYIISISMLICTIVMLITSIKDDPYLVGVTSVFRCNSFLAN
jgi:hypothetical protein